MSVSDALLIFVIARLRRRQFLDERRYRRCRASRQLAHRRRVVDLFHHDSRPRRRSRMADSRFNRGAEIPRRRFPLPFRAAQSAVEIGYLLGAQCRIVRFRRQRSFQSALRGGASLPLQLAMNKDICVGFAENVYLALICSTL